MKTPKMIKCERDEKLILTKQACIKRQGILATGTGKNGAKATQYRDIASHCSECRKGLKLYQKSLSKEK